MNYQMSPTAQSDNRVRYMTASNAGGVGQDDHRFCGASWCSCAGFARSSRTCIVVAEMAEGVVLTSRVKLSTEKDPALADDEEVLKAKETLEEVSV